jgi:type VI secretion system secreted protein VgrG
MRKIIATIIFIFVLIAQPVFAADFLPVWQNTILPHEGGYSNNIHDPGNWTGGKEGQGRFLGTKYGIAASQYGTSLLKQGLIIKHLTPDQARMIYERDYWLKFHFDKLKSQGIADELCDESVNMGGAAAERLLTKVLIEIYWATGNPIPTIPAKFTPETIAWINAYTKARERRVAFFNSIRIKRVQFYVTLIQRRPAMRQFFSAWINRSVD